MATPTSSSSSSPFPSPISFDLVIHASPPISTSSHSQASSSHSLPSLPNELKREILRFCDPSTLANTSLVSLAFLELSGPLLYHDVTRHGWENVTKLFCAGKLQKPGIEDFLSLEQIQHLTYIHVPSQQESRGLISSPLPISSLTIEFGDHDFKDPASSDLLHLFNPLTLTLRGPIPKSLGRLSCFSLTPLVRWTRLQTLTLRNAELYQILASRWFPGLERFLTLEISLSDTNVGAGLEQWNMLFTQLERIMVAASGWWTQVPTWLGVMRVLLGSKEEAERFREKVDERKAFWAGQNNRGVVEKTFGKIEVISVSSSTQSPT